MTRPRKAKASVLDIARGQYTLSEKEEERRCDLLVQALQGDVVRFSQSRATHQTEGIPDRRYRVKGVALWWEVKAEDGRLSRAQFAFLRAEKQAQSLAGCGTSDDLVRVLRCTAEGMPLEINMVVARWLLRGFRGEPQTAPPPIHF